MALSFEDREIRTRREDAPAFYRAYLNSPGWRSVRNQKLREQRYTCERCGSRRDLNVHHKTYQRLSQERMADLEVVCFTCHNGHHEREAEGTPLGIYLKVVSEVLNERPFARIPDIAEDAKLLLARRKIPHEPEKLHKAINMACATRQQDGQRPYQSVVDVDWQAPPEPITHAQAIELLKRLGVGRDAQKAVVKPMPRVEMVSQRELDRRKALEMVAKEMQASIERCAALEAAQ